MKNTYTTGEVADICRVSQQTVIRCFDNGRLKGFRVPGSRFRRIPHDSLVEFMKSNNIPLEYLESGKKRVLVVDDDEAILEMLVELLERDGRFEVRVARGGYEAGMLTQEFRPDVIVLDYKLPDVDGHLVCRTVRGNPTFSETRIIMISGVADPDEIAMLRAAGADDFLRKPFQIDELIARILQLVHV
ncbi:MAG TPA: response regulator [Phycisphaerae bacterium]|nr:response regulator [Phycisphaerae bacterium]HRY67398.1 response regulator [Phycisphaerae bacterium]HSA29845.1 response regulator [Phycisphaerae bacterium]